MVWARAKIGADLPGVAPFVQSANLLANFEQVYGASLLGATAIRIRGVMAFHSPTGTTGPLISAVGVRVADRSELDDISPDGEGPLTDRYADWMMYEPFVHGDVTETDAFSSRVIDVRAMRKFQELGQTLAVVWESEVASTAAEGFLSVLVKLP